MSKRRDTQIRSGKMMESMDLLEVEGGGTNRLVSGIRQLCREGQGTRMGLNRFWGPFLVCVCGKRFLDIVLCWGDKRTKCGSTGFGGFFCAWTDYNMAL